MKARARARARPLRRYPPLTLQSAADAMRAGWLEYQLAVALGASRQSQRRRLVRYRRLLHVYIAVLLREIDWTTRRRAWHITEGAIPMPVPVPVAAAGLSD